MKNADMPAMPIASPEHAGAILKGITPALQVAGLTKREYFAAMVMQAVCTNFDYEKFEYAAQDAVKAADALLKELEATK